SCRLGDVSEVGWWVLVAAHAPHASIRRSTPSRTSTVTQPRSSARWPPTWSRTATTCARSTPPGSSRRAAGTWCGCRWRRSRTARVTGAGTIVTMHDMRTSSAPLAEAFGRGAAAQGAGVLAGGLASTDMLYYASGDLGIPGAMITASHNPSRYNGIKLCRAGAKPVGIQTGLAEIKELAERALDPAPVPGTVTRRDLLSGYAEHLRKLVDISSIRPLTVAVDAGNGMAGLTVPKVFEGLPVTLIPLYFDL